MMVGAAILPRESPVNGVRAPSCYRGDAEALAVSLVLHRVAVVSASRRSATLGWERNAWRPPPVADLSVVPTAVSDGL